MTEPVEPHGPHAPLGPDDPAIGAGYVTVEELLRDRLSTAIGGWRGAVESALPTVAFVIVWTVTSDVRSSVIAAGVALTVLAALRLLRRETLRFVGYAAVAVAIAAFFALRSGRAEDAFLPGMIQTAAIGLAIAVTNLVRWPVFGFLIAAADPELAAASQRLRSSTKKGAPQDDESLARSAADEQYVTQTLTGWRRHDGVVRVAARVGWVIVALDAVRLLVMVPLYLAGNVAALGVAKILLGWPAYLVAVLVIGWILVRGETPLDAPPAPPGRRTDP